MLVRGLLLPSTPLLTTQLEAEHITTTPIMVKTQIGRSVRYFIPPLCAFLRSVGIEAVLPLLPRPLFLFILLYLLFLLLLLSLHLPLFLFIFLLLLQLLLLFPFLCHCRDCDWEQLLAIG